MKWLLAVAIAILPCVALAQAREANHLQGARSPYLLQHQFNPVDWYPWGPEALNKAKAENKPIFVSVGYSSCHWCHVMEDESFEDEVIAALLNAHFVSIKIDRESRPDLDEQFMLVTQLLTGGGGWPNSVFLTPGGEPFFAGGYFPPEVFQSIVTQAEQIWRLNPVGVRGEAAKVAGAVRTLLDQKAEARDVTPEVVAGVSHDVLQGLDGFNGGYGVAPKFPRETLFLFLLDQAERTGDARLLKAVTDMLDGMILGGIHDHVGGGFHRYAVDAQWHVPHFEKMIYTQAMTGRLLVRAWSATGAPRYRRAAERLFDHVIRDMRDPGGGFYAAQDADSADPTGAKVEGAFYTWTPEQLDALGAEADWMRDVFAVTPNGDLDGANVLHLRRLPVELAAQRGLEPSAFLAALDAQLDAMFALRSTRPAPFLDRKIVLSWNAAMIETLAEAAHRLDRPDYYEAATTAAGFILDHMRGPEGLHRVWFEGSAGTPGQLPDYAGLALALVALHDHAPDRTDAAAWLAQALDLAGEIRRRFGSAQTGYRMVEAADALGSLTPVDDTEIPSGNALALTLFARLAQRAQAPELELDGHRLAAALSGHAIQYPEQRGFALKAIEELQHGEAGPVRFVAKGAVRIELRQVRGSDEIAAGLTIADGWHINAHEPLDEYFVPTALSLDGRPVLAVEYPDPIIKTLAFNDTPLALYEGSLHLTASAAGGDDPAAARTARLSLQACSEQICLQPEELIFTLWPQ